MERIHGVKRRIIAFVLVLAVTICSMNVYNEEEQVVASVANWPTTSMEQVRTMYELGNAFGSTMEGYTLYDITEESNSEAIECFDMYFNITGENNDILQLKQSITMKNDTYIVLDLGYQYTIDLAGYSVVGCVNEPLILLQDYEKDREQCMDSVTFIDSSESRTGTVQNTHTISGGIFGVGGVTTSESNYDLRIDSGNYICSTGDLLIRSGESRTIINGGRFVSEDADAFFYGSIIQGPCSFESTGRGSAFSGDMNVGSGSLQDIIPDDMYAYDRYGYLIENTSEIYVISDYFELDYARELIIDEREIVTINGQYDLLDSLKLCTIEGKWVDYIGTFEDITQTNYSIKVSRGAYSLAFIEDRDGATYYEINTGESYTAEQYNIPIVKVVEESQEESGVNTTSNPIYNGRLGAAWDGYGPLYTFDGDGCFLYAPSEEVISFTYSWDKGTYRWEGIASTITSEFESDIELYSVSLEDEILYYRREADPFNKMEDPEKETALFTGWKVAVLGSESYTVKSFSEDTASLSDYRARCVSLYENFVSMDDLITEDSITAYNMETAFYDWKSNIEEPAMLPKLAASLSNEKINELVNSGYDVEVSWFAYAEGETKEEARDLTDKVEELELGTIYLPEYFEDEALIPVGKYQYFAVVNILIDGDVVLSSETELIEIEILGYDLEVSNPSFDAVSYTGLPILEDILNSEAYWSEAVMDIEENMLVIGTDYVVSYQYGYAGDSELTDGLPTNVYRDYVIRVRIDPINGYESMYSSYIYETTLTIDKCPVVAKAEDKVILFNGLTVEEQLPEIRFEDGLGNFHEVSYYYTNRYFLDYLVGEEENVNGKSFQNGVPTDVGSYTIYESIPTDPPNHKLDSTNIMGLLGEYTYFFESNLLYKIVVAFAETVGILVNGENDVAEYYSTSEVSFQIPNGYEMFIWTQSSEEESDYIGLTFDEYAGLIQEIESGDRAGEWITEYESLKEDGEYYFLYSLREIETGNISDFKVVTFTKDTQAPTTLSIRVGSSTWDSILQVLTFGLYSPTTETIVLEGGVDESSDVSKYFYIRSVDRESMQYNTIYELEADAEWVSYNEEELPEIAVGSYQVIYAKATDTSGNTVYASTDGILQDGSYVEVKMLKNDVFWSDENIYMVGTSDYSGNVEYTLQMQEELEQFSGDVEPGIYNIYFGEVLIEEAVEKAEFTNLSLQYQNYDVYFCRGLEDTDGTGAVRSYLSKGSIDLTDLEESFLVPGYEICGWVLPNDNLEDYVSYVMIDGLLTGVLLENEELSYVNLNSFQVSETTSFVAVWRMSLSEEPIISYENGSVYYGEVEDTKGIRVIDLLSQGSEATLSYQWYTEQERMIEGANDEVYVPDAFQDAGVYRYYCEVTSTTEGCISWSTWTDEILYTVKPRPLSSDYVSMEEVSNQIFTGGVHEPKPVISYLANGAQIALEEGEDFDYSYQNNEDIGEASVTIIAMNPNYIDVEDNIRRLFAIEYFTTESQPIINGQQGNNGWYTKVTSLSAPTGFQISVDELNWKDSLEGFVEGATQVSYYLKEINTQNVTEKRDITVKIDSQAPLGKIKMGTYVWSQWLSSITFGLYTKFREEIEFEGSDLSSGIQRIEYVISDRVYATSAQLEEAIAKGIETYITYQKMEKPIVYKDGKSIVYGKFIDNAGWVTYSSSNGIIQDEIAPVITVKTVGFTEGVVTNKRQTSIQVKVQDNNISNVTYQIGKSEEIIPASKSEFSIPIEEDGEYKVSIHATDMVGNRTIREINVKRDTQAPKAEEVTVDSEYEYEASVTFRASEASTLYYVIDEKGKLSYGSKKLLEVGRTKACKSGENSISFTGLMINTSYKLHYLLEDAAGNLSAPKSTTFTTAKGELKGTLTISGDATYGSLLRARLSNIRTDSGRVKYSWYRQGKEEPLKEGYGNSYAKYRIRSADVGEKIRLVVSTKNCKSTLKETTSSIAAIDSVIQVESDITPNTKKGDMIQLRIKLVNAAEEETPAGTVSVYQKGNELLSGLKFAFVDEEWVAFVRLKATTHYLDWEIRYMTGDEDGLRGSESTQKILIKYDGDELDVESNEYGRLPAATSREGLQGWTDGTTLYLPGVDYYNRSNDSVLLRAIY